MFFFLPNIGLLAATVAGFLSEFSDDRVNMVNALSTAHGYGLHLSSKHEEHTGSPLSVLSLSVFLCVSMSLL